MHIKFNVDFMDINVSYLGFKLKYDHSLHLAYGNKTWQLSDVLSLLILVEVLLSASDYNNVFGVFLNSLTVLKQAQNILFLVLQFPDSLWRTFESARFGIILKKTFLYSHWIYKMFFVNLRHASTFWKHWCSNTKYALKLSNYQKKGALKAFVRSLGRAHNDFIPFQLTTFDTKLRN